MNKEFINYESALALKELGFDEPCFAYRTNTDKLSIQVKTTNSKLEKDAQYFKDNYKGGGFILDKVAAPTFSQAFRFFREKYGLQKSIFKSNYDYNSPQEAYSAAFEYIKENDLI